MTPGFSYLNTAVAILAFPRIQPNVLVATRQGQCLASVCLSAQLMLMDGAPLDAGAYEEQSGARPGGELREEPKIVRSRVLGGFSVSFGQRIVEEDGWRLSIPRSSFIRKEFYMQQAGEVLV